MKGLRFILSKHHGPSGWFVALALLFFFIFFITVQIFAQDVGTYISPWNLEIALFRYMIQNLSSPFSVYTNTPYSSYDPFSLPYVTIPNSPGYDLFPFPYHVGSPTVSDSVFKSYDVYNPVSFLNSTNSSFSLPNLSVFTPPLFQTGFPIAPFYTSFNPIFGGGFLPGLFGL